jgi:5-methylcytosine-specific restriction protein A
MAPRLRMTPRRLVASDTRRITPIDTVRKEKKVDSFYISAEWKAFRNALRFERGWCCQDPKCETPSGPWKMIYGHHIVELTDGGAALDRQNVTLVCGTCHGRLTAENKSKREAGREQPREANAIRFGHTRMDTTLVCGPPRAGKNTYVANNMRPGDLVVDLDVLWVALSCSPLHQAPEENFAFACEARDAVYRRIAQGSTKVGHRAWITTRGASIAERQRIAATVRSQRTVVLETNAETCVERLTSSTDPRPREEMITAIERWWCEYQPDHFDIVLANSGNFEVAVAAGAGDA